MDDIEAIIHTSAEELMKEKGSSKVYFFRGKTKIDKTECYHLFDGENNYYFPVDKVFQGPLALPEINQNCRLGSLKGEGCAIVKID